MPTLSLEFEVYCSCGNGLCGNCTEGRNGHSEYITVDPCDKCQDSKYDEGHNDGYDEARKEFEEV